MECQKCKIEMKIVDFKTTLVGVKPYISTKKKGTFKGESISDVLCYVCTECGHIDFFADNPGEFK